jgi:hypothetical protein
MKLITEEFTGGNIKELDEPNSISRLFDDGRIILVSSDRESKAIVKGHLLRSRFITFMDGKYGNRRRSKQDAGNFLSNQEMVATSGFT